MSARTTKANTPAALRPIKRVLAVVEPGEADGLLRAADALATQHDAELDVLTCVERPSDLGALARAAGLAPQPMLDRVIEDRRQWVKAQVAQALPGRQANMHLAVGKTFVEVIRHVGRLDTDIVVKTAEPLTGLQGLLFASTDQHLMRKCPCAVWLRLPEAPTRPRTILATVDVDDWDASEPETLADLNRRVVETSLRLATDTGATVHVLHAWQVIGEGMIWTFASDGDPRLAAERYINQILSDRRRSLEALVRPFQEGLGATGPQLREHLIRGAPHVAIAEQARQMSADIIVMGTLARTGLSGIIIGNTAEDILNSVACSVVTVKPDGFVSPIDMK